jgi:hypothetical protein
VKQEGAVSEQLRTGRGLASLTAGVAIGVVEVVLVVRGSSAVSQLINDAVRRRLPGL